MVCSRFPRVMWKCWKNISWQSLLVIVFFFRSVVGDDSVPHLNCRLKFHFSFVQATLSDWLRSNSTGFRPNINWSFAQTHAQLNLDFWAQTQTELYRLNFYQVTWKKVYQLVKGLSTQLSLHMLGLSVNTMPECKHWNIMPELKLSLQFVLKQIQDFKVLATNVLAKLLHLCLFSHLHLNASRIVLKNFFFTFSGWMLLNGQECLPLT